MQTRKLKVYPCHREQTYGSQIIIPELRLKGLWLEKLGFRPGDRVEVTSRERLLIIQPVRDPEADLSRTELRNMKKTLKELL